MIWFWSLLSVAGFGSYFMLDKSRGSTSGAPEIATRDDRKG